MPKVISRGLNIGDDEYSKDENQLFTYHCICGALTLISGTNRGSLLCLLLRPRGGDSCRACLDVAVRDLPVRHVDNARYLDTTDRHVRLNVDDGEVLYLRRYAFVLRARVDPKIAL